MTNWRDALEIVVARTGHVRYREQCSDAHPGREDYRRLMIELAGRMAELEGDRSATPGRPAAHPSPARRAATLAREVWDWFAAGLPLSKETRRRLAICEACSHFTPSRQCDLCTCYMDLKTRLATAHCPLNPPKW